MTVDPRRPLSAWSPENTTKTPADRGADRHDNRAVPGVFNGSHDGHSSDGHLVQETLFLVGCCSGLQRPNLV